MHWVLVASLDAVARASWTVFAAERTATERPGVIGKLFAPFQRPRSRIDEPPPGKAAP